MSKRSSEQQEHLKSLVRRCIAFASKNALMQDLYTGSHLSALRKTERKGKGLAVVYMESSGLGGDGCRTITVRQIGYRRFELVAKAGQDLRENFVVSTYRRGDWEKKIPKRIRS